MMKIMEIVSQGDSVNAVDLRNGDSFEMRVDTPVIPLPNALFVPEGDAP